MDTGQLLERWRDRAARVQNAHYEAAAALDRQQYVVGLPLVVLSTLVGTSVFVTLQEDPNLWVKVSVGSASVLAAILAAVQTFLRPSERAEKQRQAGIRYGAFKREIEQAITFPPQGDEFAKFVDDLRKRWDKLVGECPTIPQRIWDRTTKAK